MKNSRTEGVEIFRTGVFRIVGGSVPHYMPQVFLEQKGSGSKWYILPTLGHILEHQKTLDHATSKKNFNSPKRQVGEDMLVQNLQPIGEDTISIDPLIFESIGKMS